MEIATGSVVGADEEWRLLAFLTEDQAICMQLQGLACGPVPGPSLPLSAPSVTVRDVPEPRVSCATGAVSRDVVRVVLRLSDDATVEAGIHSGDPIPARFYAHCWAGDLRLLSVTVMNSAGEELVSTGEPPQPTTTVGSLQAEEPPPLTEGTDGFVYLTTDTHLTVIDVDAATALVREIPELAPGDPPQRLTRRGNLLAFYGQTAMSPAVFALDPGASISPVLVDEAWFFVPSAHDERVWLAILDPDSPATVRALQAVREVALDGAVTFDDVKPPTGRWPVGAVIDGLLFQGDATLDVWDPTTGAFVHSLPGPLLVATWRNRIAACRGCEELHLIDLEAGTQQTVAAPEGVAGFHSYGGAFSPDGRYVAVPAPASSGPTGSDTLAQVVLIDFEAASALVVPGSRQARWDNPQVAWSANSEWVFFSNGGRLLAYQPGDDSAYRVPVELSGPYYGMAAQ